MTRRLQILLVAALVTAAATAGGILAARTSHRAAPAGKFTGTPSAGAPSSSFTGSGTLGGGGGGGGDDGFNSDDSSSGLLGILSSGPGGALSNMDVASVRKLQTDLAQLGYFHHSVTGYYGVITTAAVKKFQRAAGLKADGIWGARSAAALQRRLGG